MADISKITLPSGTTYNIKDAEARSQIAALTGGDAVVFVGVSSVKLTDGGVERPKVDNVEKIPATGQLFFYGTEEFIWGADSKWHALGSLDSLGALAYKDSANTLYKPAGTVSKPIFTGVATTFTGKFKPAGSVNLTTTSTTPTISSAVGTSSSNTFQAAGTVSTPTISVKTAGATTTVKNPTSQTVTKTVVAAAPGATAPSNAITYYAVSGETLSLYQLGYTTGDSITTANVTVKTEDAVYQSTQPTFTGNYYKLSNSSFNLPTGASFSGTEGDMSVSGTPSGSISQPIFDGTNVTITVS